MNRKIKNIIKIIGWILLIMLIISSNKKSNAKLEKIDVKLDKSSDIKPPRVVLADKKIEEIEKKKSKERLEKKRREIQAEKERIAKEEEEKKRQAKAEEERRHQEKLKEVRTMVNRGASMNVPNQNKDNYYMKSWMDWRASSNRQSKQYKFQNSGKVYTDSDGMRKCSHDIEGLADAYVGAIGQNFASDIGDLLIVRLANGHEFPFIVGEFKSNKHVNAEGQHLKDKSIIEFTVDGNQLNSKVKQMGNVSFLQINGQNLMLSPIVSIIKTDKKIEY